MVFFCCNGCGDSLKKQKVEQHRYSCHSSVSCIDCNVNFVGNEYKKHTTCVTEAERYQGALYQGKENKGAIKQDSWMDHVRSAADNCKHNAQLKGLLVNIAKNDNVPRKKKKFLNFIRNSMRVNNANLVEQAWEEIEKAGKPATVTETVKTEDSPRLPPAVDDTKKENDAPETTSIVDASTNEIKRKKRKRAKTAEVNTEDKTTELKAKKSKKTKENESIVIPSTELQLNPNMNHIKGITPDTPGKEIRYSISCNIREIVFEKEEISLKKLKRKVLAAYLEYNPHKSADVASRLFDRKVLKIAGVTVEHGTVRKTDES